MQPSDVRAVYELQCAVHPTHYHETESSFAWRLAVFPQGCLVARSTASGSDAIVGYTIAYPYPREYTFDAPPTLAGDEFGDAATASRISAAAADPASAVWWHHDVAVRTSGAGIGSMLMRARLERGRALGFTTAVAIAVSASGRALNEKHGFVVFRELPTGAYALRDSTGAVLGSTSDDKDAAAVHAAVMMTRLL